jgi:hypothetical protein
MIYVQKQRDTCCETVHQQHMYSCYTSDSEGYGRTERAYMRVLRIYRKITEQK